MLSQNWATVSYGTVAPQIAALERQYWGVNWGAGLIPPTLTH